MEFRGYVRALRRNLILILVCVIACLGAAFELSQRTDEVYQSRARVIVSGAQIEASAAYAAGLLSEQRAASYAEVVESGLLADKVRATLGLEESSEDLLERVTATTMDGSSTLEVRVTDGDPERARQIAQAYADQVVLTAADIEAPTGGEAPTRITVIDDASFEPKAIAPQPVRNLALGLVLGLVLGVGLALLRELLDSSITTAEDLEAVTAAPVLGTIVQEGASTRRRLVTDLDNHAPRVESFRVLRTNVQFVDVDLDHKVLVVSSSVQGEGKTSTAVNLALTLARAGVRVLLVDGDLRRPQVAGIFDIDVAAGVTTVLLGKVTLAEAIWRHETTGLDVLPSGVTPPNAAELLQSQAMATLIDTVRSQYDVVVIDSPPLLPVTDAALLAARADGVLLVVRHGRTTRDQVSGAVDRLAQVDVLPVGVVLNGVPTSRLLGVYTGFYRGYGSYAPYAPVKPRRGRGRRLARRGRW